MENLTSILTSDSKSLTLAADIAIIRALAAIEKFWRDHRGVLQQQFNISSVIELVEEIHKDPNLTAAIAALHLEDSIGAALDTVHAMLGKVADEYRKLLQPLAAFDEQEMAANPGVVSWAVLDRGQQRAGGSEQKYGFELGAKVSVEFEAGDTWPYPGDSMPDPLLRLSARGTLEARGNATLPLKIGSIGIGTDSSASATLAYYFSHPPGDLSYAGAVADQLGNLVNPLSFNDAWSALAHSPLTGLIVKLDGASSLEVEVAIAQGFTLARGVAASSIGLTVRASAKFSGDNELVLHAQRSVGDAPARTVTPSIVATLQRRSLRELGRGIELGIDVGLKPLADRLRSILRDHAGDLERWLEAYRAFLSPGTYVRTCLSDELSHAVDSVVEDPQLRTALGRAVAATSRPGDEADLSALKAFLSTAVTDTLDGIGEVVSATAASAATTAAERIGKSLRLDPMLVRSVLAPQLEVLVQGVQRKLATVVRASTQREIDALIGGLRQVGVQVAERGSAADRALSGVRDLISRYESLLRKLIAATEDAVRTKVTAKLIYEESTTNGRHIDVRAAFRRNTPAAAAAFATLVSGDFNAILELLANPPLDVEFDAARTSLMRFATARRSVGFEMVFLGFEFTSHTIFNAEASVTSDAAGDVYVETKASWERRRRTPREERQILFVDALQLAAAKAVGSLTIDLSISHKDEHLKRSELVKFLQGFVAAKALSESAQRSAEDALNEWQGMGAARPVKADINLGLRLDPKSVLRLIRLDARNGSRPSDANLSEAAQRGVFELAVNALQTGGVYSLEHTQRVAKRVYRALGAKSKQAEQLSYAGALEVLYRYTREHHEGLLNGRVQTAPGEAQLRENFKDAQVIHELGTALVQFVETLGDIYQATPDPQGATGWTERDYLSAQGKLSECFSRWLRIDGVAWFYLSDEASPRTIAFIVALLALVDAGAETGAPRLTLTMIRRDSETARPVVVS